ncbi:Phosphonoacetaldehyde hydrolase [Amphibalanus amphitrite]|uniref:Phosphonoacetaldehyde hydrolase n=1 Tax=Amphibalanus amphitrite TaxID=1232801 RepID=A0A6A4WDL4_AMPAM|nr:Phosphonoacetaldehyde hydrolase [Amphibalanus amphitrite]
MEAEYRMKRTYIGKVKAVIFDWAGTVVDTGVMAPALAFRAIFEEEGIAVTDNEVREPMGMHKRTHIEKMLEMPTVRRRWVEKFDREPTKDDVDRMYAKFVPKNIEALETHADVITNVPQTVEELRDRGIKIGSCTGFVRPILDRLMPIAARKGFSPDVSVTADEVPAARPLPHMVWLNAIRLNVSPIEAIVKVDDTVDGIREGLAAGCWTVGGNYVGLSAAQLAVTPRQEVQRRMKRAYDIMTDCGCHYVIDSVTELLVVIDDIERRLASGERP